MSLKLQVIIIVGMLIVMGYIINMVRQKKIDMKYALGWLVLQVCIIVFAAVPGLLDVISDFLGIASPVNMLFFIAILLMSVMIFVLTVTVSRYADKVKKLSQEIAIMRRDMYDSVNAIKKEG